MFRTTLLWTLAAIAGVVLVAGVTYAASGLSTQTIGLSSEPLSAGESLAPKATPNATATPRHKAAAPKKRKKPRPTRATPTPTPPPPVITAAPTVDDHGSGTEPGDDSGGHGGNSGGGGGGDD
jgi:hypothetical protein